LDASVCSSNSFDILVVTVLLSTILSILSISLFPYFLDKCIARDMVFIGGAFIHPRSESLCFVGKSALLTEPGGRMFGVAEMDALSVVGLAEGGEVYCGVGATFATDCT
jgi:hypothetical protein